jgi:DNA-binding NtrC family response regulator
MLQTFQNPKFIGKSPETYRIRKAIRLLGGHAGHILITGEAGSGRTLAAAQIHQSGKKGGQLVSIRCNTILDIQDPDTILSQFKNAPSSDNTIYLDSVDKLSIALQKQLYQLLFNLEIRIIASADPDILQKIQDNRFDAELYHFLNQFHISIPPLRERKGDILLIFDFFLEEFCREFSKPVPAVPGIIIDAILEYDWPGNVTELKNCVRNLAMMSTEEKLSPDFLPFRVQPDPLEFLADLDLPAAVASVEKFLIRRTLAKCDDNQSKAARALKISEAALRYKMKKYGFPTAR